MSIFNAYRTYGLETDPAENWRSRALCQQHDPDRWFPIGTGAPFKRAEAKALEICARCPVQPRCCWWAIEHGVTDGVWGIPEDQLKQIVAARGVTQARFSVRVGTCKRGHVMDAQNTAYDRHRGRYCRVCARETNVRAKQRQAARLHAPGLIQAAKTHCPQGHPYDVENTYVGPDGKRQCRHCKRDRKAQLTAARRSES